MNQLLQIRNLELNLEKASPEQLKELCLHYAEQLFLQQNRFKDLYRSLALEDPFGSGSDQ